MFSVDFSRRGLLGAGATAAIGATALRRSDHNRSKMSASAITDAKIRSQIGQPAAWMMDHT